MFVAWRYGGDGQPLQPQRGKDEAADWRNGRDPALSAAVQSGPESDRAGVLENQATAAVGGSSHDGGIMDEHAIGAESGDGI